MGSLDDTAQSAERGPGYPTLTPEEHFVRLEHPATKYPAWFEASRKAPHFGMLADALSQLAVSNGLFDPE